MLDSLWFSLFLSSLLGFLSGIGVGGGSLLMLWLTVALQLPQTIARSINLLFFIPSALVACCFRWRQGYLPWKTVLPAIAAGCTAAWIFSYLGTVLDTGFLRKAFGILLVLTGLRELLYRPKKCRGHKK